MTAVAARYQEIKALDAECLSISTDSHFVHKVWQEHELSKMIEGGVPYPMLSDAGGKIGRLYGVYDEEKGVNVRGRFLIDPDGIVQAMEVLTPPVGRNVAELIRQLQAFQFNRRTGQVTPSGWYPGQQALKPGPALAGKVWEHWKPAAQAGKQGAAKPQGRTAKASSARGGGAQPEVSAPKNAARKPGSPKTRRRK